MEWTFSFHLRFRLNGAILQKILKRVSLGSFRITTGVARSFDWEESKMEKSCEVILVIFFGKIMMTSPV